MPCCVCRAAFFIVSIHFVFSGTILILFWIFLLWIFLLCSCLNITQFVLFRGNIYCWNCCLIYGSNSRNVFKENWFFVLKLLPSRSLQVQNKMWGYSDLRWHKFAEKYFLGHLRYLKSSHAVNVIFIRLWTVLNVTFLRNLFCEVVNLLW